MIKSILAAFDFEREISSIVPFGTGLINSTWQITAGDRHYIFQKINDQVFKQPEIIENNIQQIASFLVQKSPDYLFVSPLPARNGKQMVHDPETGYYRLFPFITGSYSKDVVTSQEEAFEAARQFGMFTQKLTGFNIEILGETIPSFHDLSLRFGQFLKSLETGDLTRINECSASTLFLQAQFDLVRRYEELKKEPSFLKRVTHHDTKISNVLFNEYGKGLCVIDLDTVMPGYFISDVGDMMRTYLCPVSEEEPDFSKIEIRDEYYKAIVQGYYSQMKDELSVTEKKHFFYAGKFMIYSQAIRFLTDYFNGDVYYGARYPGHNKVRAENQIVLLKKLIEKEPVLGDYLPS